MAVATNVENDDDLELPPEVGDGEGEDAPASTDENSIDEDFAEEMENSRDDSTSAEFVFFDPGELDLSESDIPEGDDVPVMGMDVGTEGFALGLVEEKNSLADHEESDVEQDALGDVDEEAFSFDAGEEGPDEEEDDLREEDLPALDADADGDFDDERVGLADLVAVKDEPAPALDAEGFFVASRAQLAWVRGALAQFRVGAVSGNDIMGADVFDRAAPRLLFWTTSGELWRIDAARKDATRVADGGVAGAVLVGDEVLALRRQRGTLWVLVEREGDEGRTLMTFEALIEGALGTRDEDDFVTPRVIDVTAQRRGDECIVHISTDRGVFSFRAEGGTL